MPESKEEYVDIVSLGRGAAVELFNDELNRVLTNILDPNTDAKALRSLTLTVKFKPSEDRDLAGVTMEVKSKLASPKGVGTVVFIGKEAGHPVAMERNPKQPELPMSNVSEIGGRK
jgi:hypothetical protein